MITLVRVDERLVHGQVVVGWGNVLAATVYTVVDDAIAASDWERDIVLAGVPNGARGESVDVASAARDWPGWRNDTERRLVLVQGVETLVDLLDAGATLERVNVGGLNKKDGRHEFLPYVHLDDAEIDACRRLCAAGVILEARNLPGANAVDLCPQVSGKR